MGQECISWKTGDHQMEYKRSWPLLYFFICSCFFSSNPPPAVLYSNAGHICRWTKRETGSRDLLLCASKTSVFYTRITRVYTEKIRFPSPSRVPPYAVTSFWVHSLICALLSKCRCCCCRKPTLQ